MATITSIPTIKADDIHKKVFLKILPTLQDDIHKKVFLKILPTLQDDIHKKVFLKILFSPNQLDSWQKFHLYYYRWKNIQLQSKREKGIFKNTLCFCCSTHYNVLQIPH